MSEEIWRVQDVADHFDITPSTVRAYHSRGVMPPADGYDKRGPWWSESTILGWKRPGRGWRGRASTDSPVAADYSARPAKAAGQARLTATAGELAESRRGVDDPRERHQRG